MEQSETDFIEKIITSYKKIQKEFDDNIQEIRKDKEDRKNSFPRKMYVVKGINANINFFLTMETKGGFGYTVNERFLYYSDITPKEEQINLFFKKFKFKKYQIIETLPELSYSKSLFATTYFKRSARKTQEERIDVLVDAIKQYKNN